MVEKGVFESKLTKKQRYCPKGVLAEDIIWHMQNKEVEDVGAVQGSIRGNIYHTETIKDPKCVMLMMTTYGTLYTLEGSDKQWSYKGTGGELVTKRFNYLEVFRNHLNHKHQVFDNNYRQNYPISVDRYWATYY